ncbi:efflux transporter outer membrane subunit [Sphingobacterium siyangense]|uniref:NodT family efflux transporter outer membrane factor (OMF) lipoprotein n=1 Tax=Sphingobacterium siyangense TaxID=459529 RepID=A0A562MGS9_9SPHI|nr:TolC family protein [Sphingobacterium siyangense]TWI19145.1 NodT family efflux transporter outer membrane factor (OMF) lipoprotein [Sphingobacterium siyangense]
MKKQNLSQIIGCVLIVFTMQSCFVAKKYTRPEVVDEQLYRTDKIHQDTTSMANVSWQTLFSDTVLTHYIQEGLNNNLDIRTALENINIAQSYMKQGAWGYAPTLNVGMNYTNNVISDNSPQGRVNPNNTFNTGIYALTGQFSWEIDAWGKIRSDKKASIAGYMQSVAFHQAVKTQLISAIATSYFQLLALDEQKNITKRTIINRENSIATIQALKESGQESEVAVKQIQAQLYNAQALLIDIENNIKLTENTFSILLGKNPESISRTTLPEQKINTDLVIGVPLQMLTNRPDVKAAELELIQAFEMTNVAKSNFYPSFRITANGGLQSIKFEDLFNSTSLFSSIIGGLTQPLFNGRRIKTQHEIALANQEKSYLNFKKSVLNASKEVSDALYNYESAKDKLVLKEQEFQSLKLASEYSEELLTQGMANYLDVLTSRESSLSAELACVNTELAQLTNLVALYRAVGGGLK